MSEPIQSIAQNNYILHNIDAKKLYVQEPLFTANSGDAVYVGWRPDETVLWSGEATTGSTAMNLSEPLTAFNKVEIWNKGGQIYTIGTTWSGADTPNTCECEYNRMDRPLSGYKQVIVDLSANPSNWTNIVYLGNKVCCPVRFLTTANNYGITYYANVGDGETHLTKIVGINRKENA